MIPVRALDVLPADRTAVAPTLGNQDPAEIYQRMGAASLLATLDVARPAPEWRVDRVLDTSPRLDTIEGRVAAIKALAPVIHSAPDEDRGLLWSRVSETIDVPMQDILTTVRAEPATAAAAPAAETPAGPQTPTDHLNPTTQTTATLTSRISISRSPRAISGFAHQAVERRGPWCRAPRRTLGAVKPVPYVSPGRRAFGLAAAVVVTGLALSGCYLLEDPYDTSPAEEDIDTHTPQANPFATTPPGVCPDRSESLIQIGTMTSRGYVNVSLLPVFAGEPDMSEVTYDELANEYSEEVDPHRALLAIALDSIYSDGFEPDDVTDVRLEPIEREGTWRICNDPLDVEVKYIGTSDPADDYDPAGIWEVTSDEPFYDRGDEVHLQLSLLGTSIEGPADAWYVKRPPRAKGTWESSTMAAAFRDLEFYYNNREN